MGVTSLCGFQYLHLLTNKLITDAVGTAFHKVCIFMFVLSLSFLFTNMICFQVVNWRYDGTTKQQDVSGTPATSLPTFEPVARKEPLRATQPIYFKPTRGRAAHLFDKNLVPEPVVCILFVFVHIFIIVCVSIVFHLVVLLLITFNIYRLHLRAMKECTLDPPFNG